MMVLVCFKPFPTTGVERPSLFALTGLRSPSQPLTRASSLCTNHFQFSCSTSFYEDS